MKNNEQIDSTERQRAFQQALAMLEGTASDVEEEPEDALDFAMIFTTDDPQTAHTSFNQQTLELLQGRGDEDTVDTASGTNPNYFTGRHRRAAHAPVTTAIGQLVSPSKLHSPTPEDVSRSMNERDARTEPNVNAYLESLPERISALEDPLSSRKSANEDSEWSFGSSIGSQFSTLRLDSPSNSPPDHVFKVPAIPAKNPRRAHTASLSSGSPSKVKTGSAASSSRLAKVISAEECFKYAVEDAVAAFSAERAVLEEELERTGSARVPVDIVRLTTRTAQKILDIEGEYERREYHPKAVISDNLHLNSVLQDLRETRRASQSSGVAAPIQTLGSSVRRPTLDSSASSSLKKKGSQFGLKKAFKSAAGFFNPDRKRESAGEAGSVAGGSVVEEDEANTK